MPPASTFIHISLHQVLEETGYDLDGQVNPEDVVELSIKEQSISLFIVPNVPEDYPFKTRTRKEISVSNRNLRSSPSLTLPRRKLLGSSSPTFRLGNEIGPFRESSTSSPPLYRKCNLFHLRVGNNSLQAA